MVEFVDFVICVASCVSIPSLFLYFLEIFVIFRHKQFHNSFNKLFVIRAIANILNLLSNYYGNRLPTLFGDFLLHFYQLLPNPILAIYWFLLYFCLMADKLTTGFIQFNRLTAIVFPLSYEKLWTKLLPVSFLLSYGPSIYYAYFYLGMGINLSYSNSTHSFSIGEKTTTFIRDSTNSVFIISFVFLAICTLINSITLFIYNRKQRYLAGNNASNYGGMNANSARMERKMLIYAMWTFLAEAMETIVMLSFYAKFNFGSWWFPFSTFIVDLCTLVMPSWFMLWASASIRQQLADDFLPKSWKKAAPNKTNIVNVMPRQHFQPTINLT